MMPQSVILYRTVGRTVVRSQWDVSVVLVVKKTERSAGEMVLSVNDEYDRADIEAAGVDGPAGSLEPDAGRSESKATPIDQRVIRDIVGEAK
jgi:hypothetical protein